MPMSFDNYDQVYEAAFTEFADASACKVDIQHPALGASTAHPWGTFAGRRAWEQDRMNALNTKRLEH